MNRYGINKTNVTNNPINDAHPSWSPDGSRIVFTSIKEGFNHITGMEIYSINIDGTGLVQLTDDFHWDLDPAWSLDGSKIIFASSKGGLNTDIDVQNTENTLLQTKITNNFEQDYSPSWSPDGTKIVFS